MIQSTNKRWAYENSRNRHTFTRYSKFNKLANEEIVHRVFSIFKLHDGEYFSTIPHITTIINNLQDEEKCLHTATFGINTLEWTRFKEISSPKASQVYHCIISFLNVTLQIIFEYQCELLHVSRYKYIKIT